MLLHTYPETSVLLDGHGYPHGHSWNHQGCVARVGHPGPYDLEYEKMSYATSSTAYGSGAWVAAGRKGPFFSKLSPATPPREWEPYAHPPDQACQAIPKQSAEDQQMYMQPISVQRERDVDVSMRRSNLIKPAAKGYRISGDSTYQSRIYSDNLLGESFSRMAMQASSIRGKPFCPSSRSGRVGYTPSLMRDPVEERCSWLKPSASQPSSFMRG